MINNLMMGKRQLLCSFSNRRDYKRIIDDIKDFYNIDNYEKFFVFFNEKHNDEIFITYNIYQKSYEKFPSTISVHRKPIYNIIFSLNGLNQLIMDENNGVLDNTYVVDWGLYRNSLIIYSSGMLRIVSIKLLEIVK